MIDMIVTHVSPYTHIISVIAAFGAGFIISSYIKVDISMRD